MIGLVSGNHLTILESELSRSEDGSLGFFDPGLNLRGLPLCRLCLGDGAIPISRQFGGLTFETQIRVPNVSRASRLVALADSLGIMTATSLTHQPDAAQHQVQLDQANRKAHDAYGALKEAAADYLDAQVELVVAAREAQDAGVTVTELHTSWLDTPPEEAVIEARVEADREAVRSEQVNDAVSKILDALRNNGYEPTLRIEDVEIHGTES